MYIYEYDTPNVLAVRWHFRGNKSFIHAIGVFKMSNVPTTFPLADDTRTRSPVISKQRWLRNWPFSSVPLGNTTFLSMRFYTYSIHIYTYSAGFRNVEALGPSLAVAPFFNYIYLILVYYKCIWCIMYLSYYNLLQNNILFKSKIEKI